MSAAVQYGPLPPVETCPACLGDRFLRYDDGPTVRCEECDGTGVVPEMCADCGPHDRARAVVVCPADGLGRCADCVFPVVEVTCQCCGDSDIVAESLIYDLCPHCQDEWDHVRAVWDDGGKVRRDGCTKHRDRRLAARAAVAS